MDTKINKKSGDNISALGFGCMRLPIINGEAGNIDYKSAQEMVDYAISRGINYFDTAYVYHEGSSELFIGEALKKYPRESYFIADKMPPWPVKCDEDVDRIFEEQLKKLGTEYIDYYLLHNVGRQTYKIMERHDFYGKLKKRKEKGQIKNLGFSFHDEPGFLEEMLGKHEWDFVQIQLNYMDWKLQDAKKQYELLHERDIPIIIMEPVRGGMLANLCAQSQEIFKKANPAVSTASWALRYAASLPGIMTVLSGMSNMQQLKDNTATFTDFKPLSESEYNTINEALAEYMRNTPIPCTGCEYCMDCPEGVSIPKVFALYNHLKTTNNEFQYYNNNRILGADKQASKCISCGVCLDKCPQKIDIPAEMEVLKEANARIFPKHM